MGEGVKQIREGGMMDEEEKGVNGEGKGEMRECMGKRKDLVDNIEEGGWMMKREGERARKWWSRGGRKVKKKCT